VSILVTPFVEVVSGALGAAEAEENAMFLTSTTAIVIPAFVRHAHDGAALTVRFMRRRL
jgi:hypothetical protein